MSTVFHVRTYLQMGSDFDSRDRFLKQRADGTYEGCIIGGTSEAWSVNAALNNVNIDIALRFKMGDHVVTVRNFDNISAVNPTGTTAFVASE
jgi:hypothetical protein